MMRRKVRMHGLKKLQLIDQQVFETMANATTPVLDHTLPALTKLADYSKLWMATAAGMVVTGKPTLQRAAVRGLSSLAVTSLLTNQVGKRFWSRARPGHHSVPWQRQITHYPTSSSFPSGHSASAAAFAVGVSAEAPLLGGVLGVMAGLVGVSRVYTGAHYPSDVLVGWGIGATTALVCGKAFPRSVPKTPREVVQEWRNAPPNADGTGLVILANPHSGSGAGERVLDDIEEGLPAAEVIILKQDDDHEEVIRHAVTHADVLGVVGGDGTVGLVAKAAMESGKPLAVFCGGTFNHFAKQIGCPDPQDTIRAVHSGSMQAVDIATINNDTAMVNTASIGMYPEFVRLREKYQKRLGKAASAVIAAWRVVNRENAVAITLDGATVRTGLFFVGNAVYVPSGFVPVERTDLSQGLLDVRFLDMDVPWVRTKMIGAILTGTLGKSPVYTELHVPEFSLTVEGEPAHVAHDGEVGERLSEVHFVSHQRGLLVYSPHA